MNHRFQNFYPSKVSDGSAIEPGTILVASPNLNNTPFHRAVVLVLQNTQQGTFGVTLNRPATDEIRTAWTQMTGMQIEGSSIVQGGPIDGPVFAIHRDESLAEHHVSTNVFLSAESEKFEQLAMQSETDFRIVFGVAGWQNGQLTEEIQQGHWLPLLNKTEWVFEDPTMLWEKTIRDYGQQLFSSVVGIHSFPQSSMVN